MVNFLRLLETLTEHEVKFVVVGGVAAALQGSAHVTEDIDIVYARDPEDVERMVQALSPFEPRLRVMGEPEGVPFLFDARTILNGLNFTLTTQIGDIDVLGAITGVGDYASVLALSQPVYALSASIATPVLSLRGLIISKRAANRPKDQIMLPELEAMLELRKFEGEHSE